MCVRTDGEPRSLTGGGLGGERVPDDVGLHHEGLDGSENSGFTLSEVDPVAWFGAGR